MSKGASVVGPGVARLAKSEAGQAAGKAARKVITEGVLNLSKDIAKGGKPRQALKRSLEVSSKDVAKSVAKIAKSQLMKEIENTKTGRAARGKRKPRKKLSVKRKSIFD